MISRLTIPPLAWRADCEQRKQETIEAVKATANEQVPYNVQGVSGLVSLL